MKDYRSLTDEALFNELEMLHMSLEMDNEMDGSGELGGIIYEGYEKYFNAIYEEMDRRGLNEDVESPF